MKLTPTQLEILVNLSEGWGPFKGCVKRSEYGGRGGSVFSLYKRGLIVRSGGSPAWALTEAGRKELAAAGVKK